MFDIGWTELLIIAVVAIIVVGPKDLPRMLRSLGKYAGQVRRTAGEFKSQFDDAIRESELDDVRSSIEDVRKLNPVGQIRDSVTDTLNPLKKTADDIKGGIENFKSGSAGSDTGGADAPGKPAKTVKPAANKPAKKTSGSGTARRKPRKTAARSGG